LPSLLISRFSPHHKFGRLEKGMAVIGGISYLANIAVNINAQKKLLDLEAVFDNFNTSLNNQR
jgi:hypothetical protein